MRLGFRRRSEMNFDALYINFENIYGPEGSLPLLEALQRFCKSDEVEVYRGDGFVFGWCHVKEDKIHAHEGDAFAHGPNGELIVLKPLKYGHEE
jgi:hypothetical protein